MFGKLEELLDMKKYMLLIVAVALLMFIPPGLDRRTDVYLESCNVSRDGSTLTLKTTLATSIGYIRDIQTKQVENTLYCKFYSAFGGLNSSIGAQDTFTVTVENVCFERRYGEYELVLKKDTKDGIWKRLVIE